MVFTRTGIERVGAIQRLSRHPDIGVFLSPPAMPEPTSFAMLREEKDLGLLGSIAVPDLRIRTTQFNGFREREPHSQAPERTFSGLNSHCGITAINNDLFTGNKRTRP